MSEASLKVILDYDGTLTAEEDQVPEVKRRSLKELAGEILRVPLAEVEAAYRETADRLRTRSSDCYWEVDGVRVSYCDEGAFIFNTVTLQTMLAENPVYAEQVADRFADAEYDPVAACTNHLFHTHTAPLDVRFRDATAQVLRWLLEEPGLMPMVLTNSLGDKVERNLARLGLSDVRVLGDTRQYAIDVDWTPPFHGGKPFWQADEEHRIELRRRIYYDALERERRGGARLAVAADTLSLPGALPLLLGIPFALIQAEYTPDWCVEVVERHPDGTVLPNLAALPQWVQSL